jgi:hypothetical protein
MKYIYPELGKGLYKRREKMILYYNGAGGNFLGSLAAKYGGANRDFVEYTDTNEFIFSGNSKLSVDHLHKYINPINSDSRTVASKQRYRECLNFFKTTEFVVIHGGKYSMFLHHMGSLKHDSGYKFKISTSDDLYTVVKNLILVADSEFILLNDPWTARIDRQYRNASNTLKRNNISVTDIEYEKLVIHQDILEIERFATALFPEVNKKILLDMQQDIAHYHENNINLILKNTVVSKNS